MQLNRQLSFERIHNKTSPIFWRELNLLHKLICFSGAEHMSCEHGCELARFHLIVIGAQLREFFNC